MWAHTKVRVVKEGENLIDVINSVTGPCVLVLSPGTYYVDSSIVGKDYVSLVCLKDFGARVKPSTTISDYIFYGASHMTLRGVIFDCDYRAKGVLFKGQTDFCIEKCSFLRTDNSDCLALKGCSNFKIAFCEASDAGGGNDGFTTKPKDSPSSYEDVSHHGVFIGCVSYDHYRGNEPGTTTAGFEIEHGCHHIALLGCQAWNCEQGLRIYDGSYGAKASHNLTVVGCIFSDVAIQSEFTEPMYNISVDAIVEPYFSEQQRYDVAWSHVYIKNLLNSSIKLMVNNRRVHALNCRKTIFDLVIRNYSAVFEGCTECEAKVQVDRPAAQPKSNLTEDASSGSYVVYVEDPSVFEVGQYVQIVDSSNYEKNWIKEIDTANKKITFLNALQNDYTVANNAKVNHTWYDALRLVNNVDNFVATLDATGWTARPNYISASGNYYVKSRRELYSATLSSNLTYQHQHGPKLFLDANGSDRNVTPEAYFPKGWEALIYNTGSSGNLIFDPSGLNLTISPGSYKRVVYDGSQWRDIT